ncbi:MAG: hypothetical protein BRD35_00190 [Bacteroidetes bacterium QH_7_62_13]|nr:MAG: hypothetical protein BRD35_00190 [Bacteroidetes bacterium QH_7_62_13]
MGFPFSRCRPPHFSNLPAYSWILSVDRPSGTQSPWRISRLILLRSGWTGSIFIVGWSAGTPVGFKLGYRLDETTFYSAKGGVREAYRRNGIARALLYAMLDVVEARGYDRFVYDTFPNKHPGMTVMGLDEDFTVVRAGYSPRYQDYRLRFALPLDETSDGPA